MLIKKFKVSERRACLVVGQHRSTNRYSPVPSDFEDKLVARMIELADEHPKWGYRMIFGLLVEEGWPVRPPVFRSSICERLSMDNGK